MGLHRTRRLVSELLAQLRPYRRHRQPPFAEDLQREHSDIVPGIHLSERGVFSQAFDIDLVIRLSERGVFSQAFDIDRVIRLFGLGASLRASDIARAIHLSGRAALPEVPDIVPGIRPFGSGHSP